MSEQRETHLKELARIWDAALDFTGTCLRAGCSLTEAANGNPYRFNPLNGNRMADDPADASYVPASRAAPPDHAITGAIAFLRKNWRNNDGAEGESVKLVCDELERMRAGESLCCWIPCSERLPGNEETVLVYGFYEGKHGSWPWQTVCAFEAYSKLWRGIPSDAASDEVTHWMPLPAAPEAP